MDLKNESKIKLGTEGMDVSKVGQYEGHDVFLIEESGTWFVAFKDVSHRYWLEALNKIKRNQPEYKFTTQDGIEISIAKFAGLLDKINSLVEVL